MFALAPCSTCARCRRAAPSLPEQVVGCHHIIHAEAIDVVAGAKGSHQGEVRCFVRFLRLSKSPCLVPQALIIGSAYGVSLCGEFHLTKIAHIVGTVDNHVDLCAFAKHPVVGSPP